MSLITKVKAGSVSSLSDARFFAGMGVDWLGFDVDPKSDSFVSLELYKSIAGWVSGPKRVMEFSGEPSKSILEQSLKEYLPDYVEIDLSSSESLELDIPLFVKSKLSDVNPKALKPGIEYVVLEIDSDPFKMKEVLAALAKTTKVLINIPPSYGDARKAIAELPIAGIALQGSKELKTGIKVYDYADLLESLEVD